MAELVHKLPPNDDPSRHRFDLGPSKEAHWLEAYERIASGRPRSRLRQLVGVAHRTA